MGAEDAFGAGKVDVFLCDARGDAIREQHHLRALLSRRVDGLIVVGSRTDPRPSLGPRPAGARRLRLRAVGRPGRPVDRPRQRRARAGIAVEHLVACGRTRIAHISGDTGLRARPRTGPQALAPHSPTRAPLVGERPLGAWSEGWGRGGRRDAAEPGTRTSTRSSAAATRSPAACMDTVRDRGRGVPGRRRGDGVRQLGGPHHERPAAAHQHRHEPPAARAQPPHGPVRRARRLASLRHRRTAVPGRDPGIHGTAWLSFLG